MGKCHELYPCLEQVQHSFTEYKSYMYMFKSLSQFNYLQMPLVDQELLILSEKMSSPKVLMGFILLDLQFPVSWGGGANPPFHIGPLLYFSGQWNFEGPVVQKSYWPVNLFLKSTPVQGENFAHFAWFGEPWFETKLFFGIMYPARINRQFFCNSRDVPPEGKSGKVRNGTWPFLYGP